MSVSKKTVFILGAGASSEYGFPLGDELVRIIQERLDFPKTGDQFLIEQIQRKFYGPDFDKRVFAARRLANIVLNYRSIDEALHFFNGDDAVIEMGKLAIARSILDAERRSSLWNDQHRSLSLLSTGAHWMGSIFSMAISSLTKAELSSSMENITFVNFNYDRSLEHYFFTAFQSLGLSEETAVKIVSEMKILRPYGSVGKLPWQNRASDASSRTPVEFGNNTTDLFDVANGLETFTEQKNDTTLRSQIERALSASQTIICLGFGFHKQNLEILSLSESGPRSKDTLITAYKMNERNDSALKVRLGRLWGLFDPHTIEIEHLQCFQLFQERGLTINLATG